jgi:hypothetical protein
MLHSRVDSLPYPRTWLTIFDSDKHSSLVSPTVSDEEKKSFITLWPARHFVPARWKISYQGDGTERSWRRTEMLLRIRPGWSQSEAGPAVQRIKDQATDQGFSAAALAGCRRGALCCSGRAKVKRSGKTKEHSLKGKAQYSWPPYYESLFC